MISPMTVNENNADISVGQTSSKRNNSQKRQKGGRNSRKKRRGDRKFSQIMDGTPRDENGVPNSGYDISAPDVNSS